MLARNLSKQPNRFWENLKAFVGASLLFATVYVVWALLYAFGG